MLTTRPRGTADILPGQVEKWQYIEAIAARVAKEYGYREVRTPIFEHTELFTRGVGEDTDIVEKEMYTFQDRGERSITLRPENTAAVVRAYLENSLYAGPQPVKLYYVGPMFRYDRPQAGRFRQFHQFGVELFGTNHPASDAEVMAMAMDFYGRLGLTGLELHVNSVGCPNCRPVVRESLLKFFEPVYDELCPNCQNRYRKNPLRLLDCKSERCAELSKTAPTTVDCLCGDCRTHFEQVQQYMDDLGVPYVLDNRLVRGLDYYTHTAFEIMASDIGAQSSIGAGGRYNGLIEAVGGAPAPGIGFALGLERIILSLDKRGYAPDLKPIPEVFLTVTGDTASREGFKLLASLRAAGISADMDYQGRSLKAQMKYAGKIGARYVIIIGDAELQQGRIVLRDMSAGEQQEVALPDVVTTVTRGLGGE
ncbi:MAG TPA: histidine--tRNA ligase [Desulfotomaculum sp.]|nr:MAG: histidyl-tRNA synthetase [Desulfotomaculum sp. BICA1-6]HBX22331.1 histidine--tRNA ligase [Desulfotomaculum sp.]